MSTWFSIVQCTLYSVSLHLSFYNGQYNHQDEGKRIKFCAKLNDFFCKVLNVLYKSLALIRDFTEISCYIKSCH